MIDSMKLHMALEDAFNRTAEESTPYDLDKKWKDKLESIGVAIIEWPISRPPGRPTKEPPVPEGKVNVFNPTDGWVQMANETAMKILTLGVP